MCSRVSAAAILAALAAACLCARERLFLSVAAGPRRHVRPGLRHSAQAAQTARGSAMTSAAASVGQERVVGDHTRGSEYGGRGSFLAAAAGLLPIAVLARRRLRRRTQLFAYAAAPQTYEGAPIGPPPDLPSLLLKNRIVYLGTPINNEVTELIIAQLLYLNYESADKPVTMYINSTGSTIKNNTRYIGESKVGLETDAFAIADCMAYIKPKVMTIGIGQAYGTAAMLLGLGTKGKRFCLPNSTIMLAEPREPPARGPLQAADIQILAQEVLRNRTTYSEQLAKATGKTVEQVLKDTSRCYYMSPDEAAEYGLIDKVLTADKIDELGQGLPSFAAKL